MINIHGRDKEYEKKHQYLIKNSDLVFHHTDVITFSHQLMAHSPGKLHDFLYMGPY